MGFAEIVQETWERNTLFTALVELTYRCNLNCSFCYNDLELQGRPLSKDQYFRFFEDLREMEVWSVVLSGGEPLAHPEFFALGARLRGLGFVVRLKSNGHALRGPLARRVREEVDPFVIDVSLHGATAATHDRQTRVPGSFERLLENLEEMLALGLRIKLNSTLTAWNWRELPEMLRLAGELGVPLQVDPEVTPRDDGDPGPLEIRAPREALLLLFRLQAEAREAEQSLTVVREGDDLLPAEQTGTRYCGAGSAAVAVDPYGNVYPCVQWRRAVGNLHAASIGEIWSGSRGLSEVRRLNDEARKAVDGAGPEGRLAAFCPGQAALRTGDPTQLYDDYGERLKLHGQVVRERQSRRLPVLA